jgi:hypothetical protein
MSFSGRLERLGDTHVELLIAHGKPDAAADSQSRGLLQLRQAQELAVEAPRLAFAARRSGDLHVIQTFDEHPGNLPIRLVYERWVNKYTGAWATGLVDLKRDLEADVEKVFEIYIRTTPERLWKAIIDPESRARYQFGAEIRSDWTPGSSYRVEHPAAHRLLVEGENLAVDRPHRLVQLPGVEHVYGGWPMILSGLKTWLETGQELTTPGSLMYGTQR